LSRNSSSLNSDWSRNSSSLTSAFEQEQQQPYSRTLGLY
jgi:hypothetical protein